MKKAFFSLVIGIVLATSARSQVVFLSNPPDMSNGAFLKDQYFNGDGSTIVWTSGAAVVEAFSVQGTEDSGTTFLSFGQRGAAPYQVTLNQILFGDSVRSEQLFVDGKDIVAETITDQYFGIRFDAGDGNFNYGWINISSINAVDGGRINALAFNTIPNADITAGATSAPPPGVDLTSPELSIRGRLTIETLRKRVAIRGTATDSSGIPDVIVQARGAKVAKNKVRRNGSFKIVLRVQKERGRVIVKLRARDSAGNRSKQPRVRIIRR